MAFTAVERSQQAVRDGIASLQNGRPDRAGVAFWHALEAVDRVDQDRERRDLLTEIAELLLNAGFHDLALMAVLDAVELDDRLDLAGGKSRNLMTHANVHVRLGNLEQADATYRELIRRCTESGEYANAASASTNLAGLLANDGYTAEAVRLLEDSLDYLERRPFPDTEIKTRMTLINVLAVEAGDPDRIFAVARTLLDRYGAQLPGPYRDLLRQFLDGAVARRLEGTATDPDAFKHDRFPELYG